MVPGTAPSSAIGADPVPVSGSDRLRSVSMDFPPDYRAARPGDAPDFGAGSAGHVFGSGPAHTGAPPAPEPGPRRPRSVTAAAIALGVAIVLIVVQVLLTMLGVNRLTRGARAFSAVADDDTGSAFSDTVGTVNGAVTTALIVIGLVFAVCYALFAIATWRGHRWPRYVAPVLTLVSLIGLIIGPIVTLIIVSGIAATVALWLPGSIAYTADRRQARPASAPETGSGPWASAQYPADPFTHPPVQPPLRPDSGYPPPHTTPTPFGGPPLATGFTPPPAPQGPPPPQPPSPQGWPFAPQPHPGPSGGAK